MSTSAIALPIYECQKVRDQICIDGLLDEQDWLRAPPVLLNECTNGSPLPPQLRTTARMLWDSENLYVAFEAADPDIRATFTERDDCLFQQDVVEVFVAVQGDPDLYGQFVEFEVSPTGVLMDAYNVAPYKGLLNWDARGWRCATRIDARASNPSAPCGNYTVEMAIPFFNFYSLTYLPQRAREQGRQFAPNAGDWWRMNLYRIDRSGQPVVSTYCSWSATMERRFHRPHRFGWVRFVS